MRLKHIELFNAVYTTGSISAAARLLNVTQPTASKVLQHAEDQLKFLLFNRVKGKLIPTDEANILFQETRLINRKVESLKKTALNLQNQGQGIIRLAVVHALGIELLPKAIAEYHKKYSDIHFEAQTHHYESIVDALFEHDKDVGIALNPPEKAGISQINFGEGEFVCIYSGNEFDDYPDRLKLSDLEGRPFISIDDSGPLGKLISPHIEQINMNSPANITAQTYFLARNLVAMGAGVSIIDEFTARSKGVGDSKYKGFNPPIKFSVKVTHMESKPPSRLNLSFIKFFKNEILGKLPPL